MKRTLYLPAKLSAVMKKEPGFYSRLLEGIFKVRDLLCGRTSLSGDSCTSLSNFGYSSRKGSTAAGSGELCALQQLGLCLAENCLKNSKSLCGRTPKQ